MTTTLDPVRRSRLWWMSVALTTQAVRDRAKTQSRRDGWLRLMAGDQLALCPKYRGVRREDRELITIVDVLSVRREPLSAITAGDVLAEGFPDFSPAEFVAFFLSNSPRRAARFGDHSDRVGVSEDVQGLWLHGVCGV